jgi:hypothetical protein
MGIGVSAGSALRTGLPQLRRLLFDLAQYAGQS